MIHRFTPQILGLVAHLHRDWPALELGHEYDFDIDAIDSSQPMGPVPELYEYPDPETETARVLRRAVALSSQTDPDHKVAVILIDINGLGEYEEEAGPFGGRFQLIKSRDDVENLKFRRRAIVVSSSEFVAGMQFGIVLVAGISNADREWAKEGYKFRQFLSRAYLAISRATTRVEIHVNSKDGDIPPIFQSAIENGVLKLHRS